MINKYLNDETLNILETIYDGSEDRKKYVLRTLSDEYTDMIKKELPFFTISKGELASLNALLPKDLFDYSDNNVLFLKLQNQKYSNIGIAMLGQFQQYSNIPESINLFLAKKENINGKNQITLWKNLKNTPGFDKIYKFGNPFKVQKPMVISGRNNDNRGNIVINTNSYEIIGATRMFFDKVNYQNSKEYKLIQGILNNDYSFMDTRAVLNKADSWYTKANELVSGKLENVMFTASQLHDIDFARNRTFPGDSNLVSSKLNTKVFEDVSTIFKRNSMSNRVAFFKEFRNRQTNYFAQTVDGKAIDPYDLNYLKSVFSDITLSTFKDNLDTFKRLRNLLDDKKGITNSKTINYLTGASIKKEIENAYKGNGISQDYLGKRELLIRRMNKILNEYNEKNNKTETLDSFKFTKQQLNKMINDIENEFKHPQDYLISEMNSVINSKIEAAFDKRYYKFLDSVKDDDKSKKRMFKLIEKDFSREFFDRYNEKFDLYGIMMKNRQQNKVSEVDLIANQVEFVRNNNGKIIDAIVHTKKNSGVNSPNNKDLKWGYYKARNEKGAKLFDSYSMDKRIQLAREYKEKYKELFEKHSEKNVLGKYDYYDSFKKAVASSSKNGKYEMVASDILSRTTDKIISRIDKDTNMYLEGSFYNEGSLIKLQFKFDNKDGFNFNDLQKAVASDKQASSKTIDLNTQKIIDYKTNLYYKNYKLQGLITDIQANLKRKGSFDEEEFNYLNQLKSFLKGGRERTGRNAIWGLKDKKLVRIKNTDDKNNIIELKDYNEIYDNIVKTIKSKYYNLIGYSIYKVTRNENENMASTTDITASLLIDPKIAKHIDNSTFMAIINRDQLTNTSGASKQQNLIKGNTYLSTVGYVQPGLVFNKVSQRTYQAQDVLGEQIIETENGLKTVSELNTEIIKRLGFSGVNNRRTRYTSEELYKKALNDLNIRKGINDSFYERAKTYKTFAIGDVNINLKEGLNGFNASFQEGMTAAKSMVLTTNAIRNKTYNINLEELDIEKLGITKGDLNRKLQDYDFLTNTLSKILNNDLYNTIQGRKKYENILKTISNESHTSLLDGSYKGMYAYYENLVNILNIPKKVEMRTDTEKNRMFLTREIYNILGNLRSTTKSIALPTTHEGKNIITTDLVKGKHQLKPEGGFTIRDYKYNPQTKNIELYLENIGLSTQGTKGQTTGAKFTVSEVYDFLKVNSGNNEIFIDAVFNNKAEKRTQTGMIIHSALQTVFTNVYESAGTKGVEHLRENLKELLNDLQVSVDIKDNNVFEINETYLTRSFKNKYENMTSEEFEQLMTEPLENTFKVFSEKGKEILDTVTKKYSTKYVDEEDVISSGAHFGIVNTMQSAYSKTYRELGLKEIPFTVRNANVTGISGNDETNFGKGSLLLLKLASDRVNSNSSKKKEDALKISREMLSMLKAGGYKELTQYVEDKNYKKVNKVLGEVYSNLNNADILRQIHSYKNSIDMSELNKSISESVNNGVLLDLSKLTSSDYILNDDIYTSHSKLMSNSILGQAMVAKGLDSVRNGKLENEINVVINDEGINEFSKQISNSLNNIKNFFEQESKNNNKFSNYNKTLTENYNAFLNIRAIKNMPEFYRKNLIDSTLKSLNNNKLLETLNPNDIVMAKGFLKLARRYASSNYSLEQLQTLAETGNLLTTMRISYDVSETDGTIVPSQEFSKLMNIARTNFEFSNFNKSFFQLSEKMNNKDTSVVNDLYENLKSYYSNQNQLKNVKLTNNIFQNLNFSSSDKIDILKEQMSDVTNLDNLKRASIEGLNSFIIEFGNILNIKDENDFNNKIMIYENKISDLEKEISLKKQNILEQLNDDSISNQIKTTLSHTIFEDKKMNNNKSFKKFYLEEVNEYFETGFNLLKEYSDIPEDAGKIFKKKHGNVVSAQKYKIDSSLVANPLEGSNYLNKVEELLFDRVKNKEDFKKNLTELQNFLGTDIVNKKLFQDGDINLLDGLDELNDSLYRYSFDEKIDILKKSFNKNASNLSEITITDKRYTASFRSSDFEWKDFYTGKSINDTGFVRETAFLGRHPQQTINHMGAVMNITIDRNSKNLTNRYARAALTFLPVEKNNAGVITVGKKTMSIRRGDHDGDKIQVAFTDFLKDELSKNKTEARAHLDYQLKNGMFGDFDEITGRYKRFYGSIKDDENNLIQLEGLSNADVYKKIEDVFGMKENDFNMYSKMRKMYYQIIEDRVKKEFKKHYNGIYDIMADLDNLNSGKISISNNDIKLVKSVFDMSRQGISSETNEYTKTFLRALEDNRLDEVDYGRINLVVGAAIHNVLTKDYGTDVNSLYKDSLKIIDKFTSRGDFDRFDTVDSAKAVFDELTGIRNTGMTHTYATQLRMASIELSQLKPEEVMNKIGSFGKNLSTSALEEMVKKQAYYNYSIDPFVDNMIESAISSKHGLTLGGLEGSKIFINSLLSNDAEPLNNKIIKMYDDIFINNDNIKFVNLLENIVSFKQAFNENASILEEIENKAVSQGLNKDILYKRFDLGYKEFEDVYSNILTKKEIDKYQDLAKEYKKGISEVEFSAFKKLMKNNYVDSDEFEIFKGLNLFGELLIQNEPGVEYEVDDVISAINKFREDNDLEKLLSNSEIKKIKNQAYISLGSAAAISNVANLRKYMSAFYSRINNDKLKENFYKSIMSRGFLAEEINKHGFDNVFDIENLTLNNEFKNKETKELKKVLETYSKAKNSIDDSFYKEVESSTTPMTVYSKTLNANNILFSHSGKSGDNSLDLIKEYKEYGVPSFNESSLSDAISKIDVSKNMFLNNIIEKYKEYDTDFENFSVNDIINEIENNQYSVDENNNFITRLDRVINEAIFNKYKNNIKDFKISNSQTMKKIIVSDNLNSIDKKLKSEGKIWHFFKKEFNTKNLEELLKSNPNQKLMIDNMSLFYDSNNKINKRRMKSIINLSKKYNLYFSDKMGKTIFTYNNMSEDFMNIEDRRRLGRDLLNAYKYLGENITEENALKRMEFKFDSKLTSSIAVEKYLKENNINYSKTKKLKETLSLILDDFKNFDNNISNEYINENYLKLARTYVDNNKNYRSIRLDSLNYSKKIKSSQKLLRRIIEENGDWFERNNIDTDIFEKMSMIELLNNDKKDNTSIRNILLNTASAIHGRPVENPNLKYNKFLDDAIEIAKSTKGKVGIAGLIASGALIVNKMIKPFFEKTGGIYTVSKSDKELTDKELATRLSRGNIIGDNLLDKDIKDTINPNYIINNKKYF